MTYPLITENKHRHHGWCYGSQIVLGNVPSLWTFPWRHFPANLHFGDCDSSFRKIYAWWRPLTRERGKKSQTFKGTFVAINSNYTIKREEEKKITVMSLVLMPIASFIAWRNVSWPVGIIAKVLLSEVLHNSREESKHSFPQLWLYPWIVVDEFNEEAVKSSPLTPGCLKSGPGH